MWGRKEALTESFRLHCQGQNSPEKRRKKGRGGNCPRGAHNSGVGKKRIETTTILEGLLIGLASEGKKGGKQYLQPYAVVITH